MQQKYLNYYTKKNLKKAGIAFAVYKYLTPDYLEDFDPDDYSDDFDDDYIEFSDGEPEAED